MDFATTLCAYWKLYINTSNSKRLGMVCFQEFDDVFSDRLSLFYFILSFSDMSINLAVFLWLMKFKRDSEGPAEKDSGLSKDKVFIILCRCCGKLSSKEKISLFFPLTKFINLPNPLQSEFYLLFIFFLSELSKTSFIFTLVSVFL